MIDPKPCRVFGEDLALVRRSRSMTQEQVAFSLGHDVEFIERLESEKVHSSRHLIQNISEIFNLDLTMVSGRIWCDPADECKSFT